MLIYYNMYLRKIGQWSKTSLLWIHRIGCYHSINHSFETKNLSSLLIAELFTLYKVKRLPRTGRSINFMSWTKCWNSALSGLCSWDKTPRSSLLFSKTLKSPTRHQMPWPNPLLDILKSVHNFLFPAREHNKLMFTMKHFHLSFRHLLCTLQKPVPEKEKIKLNWSMFQMLSIPLAEPDADCTKPLIFLSSPSPPSL